MEPTTTSADDKAIPQIKLSYTFTSTSVSVCLKDRQREREIEQAVCLEDKVRDFRGTKAKGKRMRLSSLSFFFSISQMTKQSFFHFGPTP
ncbi:hypothetical protein NC652_039940 [Populus alba x Populus x berolinensis]|nr:hypothetical protein NC652_039937 [Populus alba x Populus x berolinensis]KAJ6863236.1 hypothetical protein NC652_039940 [Populus alba x Populus x berolinensis]